MTGPPFRLLAHTIGSTAARLVGGVDGGASAADRVAVGTVAATFERSCYLELGGQIVALVLPDLLNGPINIVVSRRRGVVFTDMHSGDEVHLEVGRAALWPAELRPIEAGRLAAARTRIAVVEAVLSGAPPESLAQPEGNPWRASEAISGLADGLRRGDADAAGEAASRLAGLGPGLTPSGDDMLTGAMTALTLVRGEEASALRRAIADAAVPRTTRLSAAYLDAAARGEAGEAWHMLRDALAGPARGAGAKGAPVVAAEAEAAKVEEAARRVLAFGETSGADMLAGFVLAFRAVAS